MVEIVAVKVVDHHAEGARAHEGVQLLILEEQSDAGIDLVAVIAPDRALAGLGVIRGADAGMQHQMGVAEHPGRQDDQPGRLLQLFAGAQIDIGDRGDPLGLAVVIEFADISEIADLDARILGQHRQQGGLRAGLGVGLAAEALAMAAILAAAQSYPFRIGIGIGGVRRGRRERVIPQRLGRRAEQHSALRALQRPVGIVAAAPALEGIAALLDLATEIAGLAGDAAQIFEAGVMALQLVIAHRPIGDDHVVGDHLGAIALGQMRAQLVIRRQETVGLAVPMGAHAADAVARQEGAEAPHRQRGLRIVAAQRNRLHGGIEH